MNSKPRVFVTRRLPDSAMPRLHEHCEVDQWTDSLPPSRDELLSRIEGAAGLLCLLSDGIDSIVMDRAGETLKVISNYAVGYNNIDVPEARHRGIAVGNTPDVLTDATADIAVTLMLAAARRVKEASDQVRSGDWKTWEPTGLLGWDLSDRTLGIIGMGRIGQATARRLHGGWNMNVIYTARSPKPDIDSEMHAKHVSLEDLLQQSDFVSVHTDLNDETRHLLNSGAFALMKSSAVLVNTARGDIIDQDALAGALSSGKIGAAGLDVTTPEPLPHPHPLVDLPNCIILPHIGSATHDSRDAMAEIAVDNILAGVQGKPLRAPVV